MVLDSGLQELVLAAKKRQARLKTSCAAYFLTAVHGIGQCLAIKKVIATMLSHGLLNYDVCVVGPGSLATATYLCGGNGTLQSSGSLPNDTDMRNAE